jgi:syntaxin 16
MAIRNLTEDFKKMRSQFNIGAAEDDRAYLIEMNDPRSKPGWLRKLEEIRTVEREIEAAHRQIEAKQKEVLRVTFGADKDDMAAAIERDVEALTNRFADAKRLMDQLEIEYRHSLPENPAQSQLSLLHNVKSCVARELDTLSLTVRSRQRSYKNDMEKIKRRRTDWSTAGVGAAARLEEAMKREQEYSEMASRGVTQEQIEQIEFDRQMAEDRDRELSNILASVKTLHDMFEDVHTMVVDQGTILDRIESTMQMTHKHVQRGKQEVEKAAKYQKAGTFRLMLLLLIIFIAACLIAVAFKVLL